MNDSMVRHSWALSQLRRFQVRITPVRQRVLECLSRRNIPVSLAEISHGSELANQFDDATVYRTLVLLVELEVVRQIPLQGRIAYFMLNMPGECFTFLICRSCGAITPVSHPPELALFEKEVQAVHGYANLVHELELHGICPNCQKANKESHKPTKLLPGLRLRGRHIN